MSKAYSPLKVNEGKEGANPPSSERFITALKKSLCLSFRRENPWGTNPNINLCVLSFWSGEWCSKWELQALCQRRQRVFGFWGHSHPSQVFGITEKNSRILSLSWLWIRPSLDSACLGSALILTLLRHDGKAFKYKACEKWQIRVGQISHLLKDDTVFARRTPKINLILQIIHKKKIPGINLDRIRFLQ